jgi:hypothetical protein
MRQVAMRLHIVLAVVAVVALALAAGSGLPGLVLALAGPATHVCTCAIGGNHATCPVCNPSLGEQSRARSSAPAAQGAPCGDPRVAIGAPGELSTLPSPLVGVAPAGAWVRAPRTQRTDIDQVIAEPATPPPRSPLT